MASRIDIRRNRYHDSVQLMFVTGALRKLAGVEQALIAMGTAANKEVFAELGFADEQVAAVGPDDMIVGVQAVDEKACEVAMAEIDALFRHRSSSPSAGGVQPTFEAALQAAPRANLCVISVPGDYARAEAEKALDAGLHVLIFSDNVPLADERALKMKAGQRGLLCMGPDCGVANVNGVSFLVGSIVGKGPIGICGASGAGVQQVSALIDLAGSGVSQAIGTGGRDLRDEIGGITMLAGIDALERDSETEVIVLISRRPGARSLAAVLDRIGMCGKPVVVNFIGCALDPIMAAGAVPAVNLEEAARKALELAGKGGLLPPGSSNLMRAAGEAATAMAAEQKYVRGLFCGGTFCEEAMTVMSPMVGLIRSNAPLAPDLKLASSTTSVANTIVDYGEEEFTKGRPHPVLDPEIRRQGILREADDPETAVILLDFILGPAVHPDPVGAVIGDIRAAMETVRRRGGRLAVVASVCGTDRDPQNRSAQERMLSEAGVIVAASNVQAAMLAGEIIRARKGGR